MANQLLQTLTPLLSSIILLLAVSNTALSQTMSFAYDFTVDRPIDLIYQGNAHFPTDSTFLRLTDALPCHVGRVLYSKPVQFGQSGGQVDFESTVNFIITPGAADNEPAYGLAFFIAPVGSTIPLGSCGANLGIFGPNGNSPSVFAMGINAHVNDAWDPNYPHIGIHIESRIPRNLTKFNSNILGRQVTAWITYVGATRMISVRVTAGSQTFDVSYEYDLSDLLPQQVQVGLSAATGQHVAVHDIVSWNFRATVEQTNAAARSRKELAGNIIRQFV
ncbi:mannose/glucose-specific lectin Cramoll-like [Salvia miltiorrhiza]|uniref:mannose/glucose-specific lectin Cramoll-like n=1 Tax=Salvia miltiorrhiza TaxID=226208 RepID=UPI0025ACAC45|nr:mannose/glucose-specific lectin Cramoll-like [Salvia miltiorrhiza]